MGHKLRLRLASHPNADGARSVEMRYGEVRFVTGVYCREEDWDQGEEMVRRTDRNARQKNTVLGDMVNKIMPYVTYTLTPDRFKELCYEIFRGTVPKSKVRPLLSYWDEFVKTKKSPGTLRTYDNARKKVEEFDAAAVLDKVNKGWLIRFEADMKGRGYSANYISIIMRCLRAVWNYCIDCEYTASYPFRRFTIKQEETKKRCLTEEELRTLRDYPVEDHQRKYRDCFMLCFYLIGINLADLFLLMKDSARDGVIYYRRAKTSKLYEIRIEPEAQEIIDRWAGKEHLLSWADEWSMENFKSRMNKELKRIGTYERKGRGGKKIFSPLYPDLSSYWSRHTWATLASEYGIPIDTIAHALGHSDESHKVTNIYIRYDVTRVFDANRLVLDHLRQ